jgi:3-oxoacyl-[acyl-carrier protein] reductase
MELNGKVAIVTGAGQGLGKAIVLELAKAGANVVVADVRKDTIEEVKKEVEGMGRESLAIQMDVSKWEEAEAMVKKALERFGHIDILVNNAGISPKGKGGVRLGILDIGDEDWDKVMNVNVKGVFNCSKAVMPHMIGRRTGKIVNMGSITGLTGGAASPASAHYPVSKAAVICLTKVLARELAQYNINVNAIAPGRIQTEMAALSSPQANEEARKQTPLGRFGRPIDIARAVLYLVSESGDFVTGETMVIDGGRTMH